MLNKQTSATIADKISWTNQAHKSVRAQKQSKQSQTQQNHMILPFSYILLCQFPSIGIIQIKQFLYMEPMEDQNCTLEFQEVYQLNRSADDMIFDQIIAQLQEVLISADFENALSSFMKGNWDGSRKQQQVFAEYSAQLKAHIQNTIRRKVPEFSWPRFNALLTSRKAIIDEQILDTLLSLEDLEHFKAFQRDYRSSFEEEEMHKVLSVKNNKIAESKRIKSKLNIFTQQGENQSFELQGRGVPKPLPKRKSAQEKTEDELLVPDLILTVKPLRKK